MQQHTSSSTSKLSRACALFLFPSALLGCSSLPPAPIGHLSLALASGAGDSLIRLRNARFELTGTENLELDSEDSPLLNTLERPLPEGAYQLHLLDGWFLEDALSAQPSPVPATLLSENPVEFSIETGRTTDITFRFQSDAGPVSLSGEGQLTIGIEVDGVAAVHVLISEVMSNPLALPDSAGEWVELYNAGQQRVELEGCTFSRDNQGFELDFPIGIEPGDYLTLANDSAPGFTPDIVYTGLTLPNSGSHVLRLNCQQQTLDEVTLDLQAEGIRPGHSASLAGNAMSAIGNDTPSAWCESQASLGEDFGSPGQPNRNCE